MNLGSLSRQRSVPVLLSLKSDSLLPPPPPLPDADLLAGCCPSSHFQGLDKSLLLVLANKQDVPNALTAAVICELHQALGLRLRSVLTIPFIVVQPTR